MPYRASEPKAPKTAAGDTGLVGEIIRQFADPLAFYRELVQNALDAGATRIDVRLLWEGHAEDPNAEGTMHASIIDDGEGMTRDILENRLLVLFRSGKEGQKGKIGKFGIGFSSVLALSPTVVTIHTTRPPDDRWTLELHPDLSYDLFAREGRDASGTTVTLRLPMLRGAVDDFVARSVSALTRWCRHARIPVTVRCFVAGHGEPMLEKRVDEPFDLEALVKVTQRGGPDERTVVVGVPADGRRYAGFFKHGLMLFETDEQLVGSFAFKIQDPRLEHTLSRDNVRRDAAFAEALDAVRELIAGPLVAAATAELRRLAKDHDGAAWVRTALAIDASGLEVPASAFAVPRIAAAGEREVTTVAAIRKTRAFVATGPTELALRAAEAELDVVDTFTHGAGGAADAVSAMLERRVGRKLAPVEQAVAAVTVLEGTADDVSLVEQTRPLFRACGKQPCEVRFVRVEGVRAEAPCLAAPKALVHDRALAIGRGQPITLVADSASECPLGRRDGVLLFNVAHPLVAFARQRAAERPVLAAALLARVALLTWGLLDEKKARALTREALSVALPETP